MERRIRVVVTRREQSMSDATARRDKRTNSVGQLAIRRPVLIFVGVLIAIVLTSYGIRIATDAPFLISGTEPEPEDFESRYVAHPWLAYLHMTPGVLYLLGAPLQLSRRIRTKHYMLHRRFGRVLVTAALLSVIFTSARRSGLLSACTCSRANGGSVRLHL